MAGTTIIPDPTQVELVRLTATAKEITAVMRAYTTSSRCPVCDVPSARVHSRSVRQVADLPWCESTVCLQLQVRRFLCDHPICPRIIFTERLPGVVAPYARRTLRLARLVAVIGFLLGGSAGSRLLWRLASGTNGTLTPSRDTILRAIRRTVLPSPRVVETLSVDDFAFRRGST
jgi:transposase